jgi:hypothetical protein
MRICKYCGLLKPFDPQQKSGTRMYGFHGHKCWDCHVLHSRSIQREVLSTGKTKGHTYIINQDKRLPSNKLTRQLRIAFNRRLKSRSYKKPRSVLKLLAIDLPSFYAYIEAQFKDGMSWENYGKVWHLDHKIPISSAINEIEFMQLWHYTNLRPLLAFENLSKGSKYSQLEKDQFHGKMV